MIKEKTKWKELSISNNFVFTRIMLNEDICKEFIETLLDIKVNKIDKLEIEKTVGRLYESKSIRLDLYLKADDNVINLEMQVASELDLAKRSRYYQSVIDTNNLSKGKFYESLPESIIIFICLYDPFKKNEPIYYFENKEKTLNIKLNDGTTKIFFNTTAYDKIDNLKIRSLLHYINSGKCAGKFIEKLDKEVKCIKRDERLKGEYMFYNAEIMRMQYEGIKIGEKKGIEIGEKNYQSEIIHELYNSGQSINYIMKITKLTKSEVEEILNKNPSRDYI